MDRDAVPPALVDKPAWELNALPSTVGERDRVTELAAVRFLSWVYPCHVESAQQAKGPSLVQGALAGF